MFFDVLPSDIAENLEPGEDAPLHTVRLAREKAQTVAALCPMAWVLGTDTVVVLDGEILGKPENDAAARSMLGRLSGREHQVVTGVCLVAPGGGVREELHEASLVRFRRLTAEEIGAYVASGEPRDKAGAYGIQGGAADFVARLQGSYENVVGLPVDAVREMLTRAGLYPPRVGP